MNRGFLDAFVGRFKMDVKDDWLRANMQCLDVPSLSPDEDPAMLLRALQLNFKRIYIPSDESVRIGKWIFTLARGFIGYRYKSSQEYVDICMSKTDNSSRLNLPDASEFSADSVPIYAVDGLPGAGKSALFRALKRVFPVPQAFTAEGDPPQRIGTVSALWVSVSANFSVKSWIKDTFIELGIDLSDCKGLNSVESLTPLMFKTLYRMGVAAIIVDELQFASGRTSARRVLSQLLAMREFGVPIIFFANSDLLINIERAPAQVSQRIPHDRKTLLPLLRNDPAFSQLLCAQLNLAPYGHEVDLPRDAVNIYDMVAGSPRACAKLIELGCANAITERRKLTMLDLVEAKRSSGFDVMRKHISLLTATAPVDTKRYPELASNNDQFDAAAAYERQMYEQRIADAAALSLFGAMTEREREATRAAETKILRDAGKIPKNVAAVGESKIGRKPKPAADDILKNSYAAKRLAKFPPRNPTDRG